LQTEVAAVLTLLLRDTGIYGGAVVLGLWDFVMGKEGNLGNLVHVVYCAIGFIEDQ
jgi:hypothetical protein